MSVLFAALLVADTILDVVVQANADSFLTLKQLDSVLRRRDLSLDDTGLSALAAELGRTVGATDVVSGEVWLEEGRWRIAARRLKVADGTTVAAAKEEGARAGLAVTLAARGKFDQARRQAKRAQANRFVPLAILAEAFAARKMRDNAEWRGILERGVIERRGFLHALGYLAEDRMEQGDDEAALAILDRYLMVSPDHPWAMAKKGRELARTGQPDEAIAISEKALSLNPGDPELLIETASRYIDAGRDPRAEPLLDQALNATPKRPLAALRLGYLYLRTHKLPLARQALEQCLELASRDDEARTRGLAHADLARVNARQDRYADAVAELHKARGEGNNRLPCDEPELARWKDRDELRQVCIEAEAALANATSDDSVPVEF